MEMASERRIFRDWSWLARAARELAQARRARLAARREEARMRALPPRLRRDIGVPDGAEHLVSPWRDGALLSALNR